jgi:cation transport protein ChaC
MPSPARQNLKDGSYRSSLAIPAHLSWSPEQIEQSLDDMLRNRPEGGPTWVSAYGSLMWNPAIEFDVQRVGVLEGWHRSFCIRSVSGRGSPEHPGRMLALEPGGQTVLIQTFDCSGHANWSAAHTARRGRPYSFMTAVQRCRTGQRT